LNAPRSGRAIAVRRHDRRHEGRIKAPRLTPMPLAAATEAHLAIEARRVRGKIVLKPWM
jgi:NADPH:quinone reductase-like Zn-dependent oxidoreductase